MIERRFNQLLAGQTLTNKISRFRLQQHGYIVKDGEKWQMRAPIFEIWLRKFGDTFENRLLK